MAQKREQFIDDLLELGFPIEKIYELVDKIGVYSLDKNFAFEYLSTQEGNLK